MLSNQKSHSVLSFVGYAFHRTNISSIGYIQLSFKLWSLEHSQYNVWYLNTIKSCFCIICSLYASMKPVVHVFQLYSQSIHLHVHSTANINEKVKSLLISKQWIPHSDNIWYAIKSQWIKHQKHLLLNYINPVSSQGKKREIFLWVFQSNF